MLEIKRTRNEFIALKKRAERITQPDTNSIELLETLEVEFVRLLEVAWRCGYLYDWVAKRMSLRDFKVMGGQLYCDAVARHFYSCLSGFETAAPYDAILGRKKRFLRLCGSAVQSI